MWWTLPAVTETVNKEACDKLAFISFKDYQDVMKRATTVPHKAEKYTTQWKLVQTYCRTMRENDYRLEVPYKIAGGRIVAEGCALQRINKLVRGALCHGRHIDYDMVNCHPVLLVHICKTRNIPCRHLERYMSNREEHLKALMDDLDCTRDDAKFLFLSSANYDQARTTFTAPKPFAALVYIVDCAYTMPILMLTSSATSDLPHPRRGLGTLSMFNAWYTATAET